jgi:hypothetical protein
MRMRMHEVNVVPEHIDIWLQVYRRISSDPRCEALVACPLFSRAANPFVYCVLNTKFWLTWKGSC